MTHVLLLAAMAEETTPVLAGRESVEVETGRVWRAEQGDTTVTLVTCGIGLVNSAAATAVAISQLRPDYVISLGSAGGLGADVRVGDIIVGRSYRYADADATAFGYEYGQIPSMPATFPGDERLLELVADDHTDGTVHIGDIVSGNSFVAGDLAHMLRKRFPQAMAADMESTAIAQVAWQAKVPFVCVRSISDLCTPQAGSDFKGNIDDVAARSAAAVWRLVEKL
ncbi:5'-methylthioadenosine/adenosylhomocysteine nucleosidase [Luteococcus sp. Sow4_B9]|uniref:5'-methylthioadenosine/adenosylhomocysteine nucleosidase n=1 Tax=Luteococcus sp. Sow4_B9 TaxID=3438792 RepID=UPI003F9C3624